MAAVHASLMESLPEVADVINLKIQRISGGSPTSLSIPSTCTCKDLKDKVAEAMAVGPLSFKLFTEDGTILPGDLDTRIADLPLPDGSAISMITDSARDYSRIKEPEVVLKTGRYPAGILIDRTGNLYVSHYYGEMKVYDKDFALIRETTLPREPKQLALAPSGELVIVFPSRIGVFDSITCEARRWFGSLRCSRGIALEGDVVFASDSRENVIHKYNLKDGELLGRYSPGLNEPCGMTVVDGRLLAVADRGSDRVLLLDKNTFELYSQLPPEGASSPCLLRKPNDIKVDAGGNLLVMDTGHARIAVFREDGSLVASVLQGFFRFCGSTYCNLCYNHITGAIAASNDDSHCITVFSPIFATDSIHGSAETGQSDLCGEGKVELQKHDTVPSG